MTDTASVSLGL